MNSVAEAVLKSWQLNGWVLVLMVLSGAVYVRGWRRLHRQQPQRFGVSRLVSFLAGLGVILIAIASPLDAFASLLLTVHMIQHLLLMMLAPPLILYGAPYLPLLRGLPQSILRHGVGPFLGWPALQKLGRWLTHPLICLGAFIASTVTWHIPVFYELALRSESWHEVEHLCFLGTALLFWWPVIQPWPSHPQWPRWAVIPYLLLADFQNTALSAFLVFAGHVVYPTYGDVPRLLGLSALEDQSSAGAIMWVPGSLAYLIPAGLVTIELLSSKRPAVRPSSLLSPPHIAKDKGVPLRRARRRGGWDLLEFPVAGRALRRWPYFRRAAQVLMFTLALIIIADGLWGPQMGPMNLAGVLPWTHWRGLVAITLLTAGNFFCMSCPFMLTRDVGRRFLPARLRWPGWLRTKWVAVALLATYLWAYEAFGLWDSPWWTAWIVIGYFVAALVIDGLFQGASFCKYVCPIGQYNFIQSLISPLEVKVRSLDVCRACTTHDCIRGSDAARGCELQLFQPKKVGNLDCTFCLDCLHACPHRNVGIISSVPGSQLTGDPFRSSIGRLSRRTDVAALILLLVFGAFVNGAGMIGPVAEWERAMQGRIGFRSPLPIVTGAFVFGLLILPVLLAAICGRVSKVLSGLQERWKNLTCSFVIALVPLGFSMWLAHLSFHLLTGALTVVPVAQRAAMDLGIGLLGAPDWAAASMARPPEWLPSLQILLLDGGLLLTLYVGWRIALRFTSRASTALVLLAPWAVLSLSLYLVGIWIIFQPMQMRGIMPAMIS